eukprot:CAMPEP_0170436592 /NCGR_PEP_ID=MMETSP0117_2-20130122/44224_1 /TAXON_ID=400756 /ORGANISM="Durinskia baltica, Strain CSIRO CS-38" /LENGTH=434 /DNA_ID=CAMNT_0010696639 /DNA_START=70 /DNA_END=1371 /DNA_ORIENTATION=-
MATSTKQRVLKKETEMRCEVAENTSLTLKLVAGSAEIFGIEMAPNKEYNFKDQNIAVFHGMGARLRHLEMIVAFSGDDSGLYESDSTPMVSYVNTHIQLESRRDIALSNKDNGPRIMIVGPAEHGKTTLAQILSAYAVRLDRTPILVDLDVDQGKFCIPGCITAMPLDKTALSVETGFKNITPLVYFHGYAHPKENVELYRTLISSLAAKINDRVSRDLDARSSGLIVDTSGWIDGEGFNLIMHAIQALSVDVVLVMSHDKLYSNLGAALQTQGMAGQVTVVKLPRSGGVVTKDANVRKRLRKNLIKEYFYGRTSSAPQQALAVTQFSPERRESVPLSAFTFLRVGGIQLSEGMQVFGRATHQDAFKLAKIAPTKDLAYCVVAVLHTDGQGVENTSSGSFGKSGGSAGGEVPQSLMQCNVAGFVSIVQVDMERG